MQQEDENKDSKEKKDEDIFEPMSRIDDPLQQHVVSYRVILHRHHAGSSSSGFCEHLNNREETRIKNITFVCVCDIPDPA